MSTVKRKIIYKNAAFLIFWLGILGLKLVYKDDFPISVGFCEGILLAYGLQLLFSKTYYLTQYQLDGQVLRVQYLNNRLATFERTFDLSQIVRLKYNRATWFNAYGSVFIRENEQTDALKIFVHDPSVWEKMSREIPALNRLDNSTH
jgi:hypothetical protein